MLAANRKSIGEVQDFEEQNVQESTNAADAFFRIVKLEKIIIRKSSGV